MDSLSLKLVDETEFYQRFQSLSFHAALLNNHLYIQHSCFP